MTILYGTEGCVVSCRLEFTVCIHALERELTSLNRKDRVVEYTSSSCSGERDFIPVLYNRKFTYLLCDNFYHRVWLCCRVEGNNDVIVSRLKLKNIVLCRISFVVPRVIFNYLEYKSSNGNFSGILAPYIAITANQLLHVVCLKCRIPIVTKDSRRSTGNGIGVNNRSSSFVSQSPRPIISTRNDLPDAFIFSPVTADRTGNSSTYFPCFRNLSLVVVNLISSRAHCEIETLFLAFRARIDTIDFDILERYLNKGIVCQLSSYQCLKRIERRILGEGLGNDSAQIGIFLCKSLYSSRLFELERSSVSRALVVRLRAIQGVVNSCTFGSTSDGNGR